MTSPKNKVEKPEEVIIPETMIHDEENEAGSIRISDNVVATIVRKYTLEVDGVIRFASGSLVGNLSEIFGRRDPEKNLQVDLDNDEVNIGVTLVLEFGVRVPDIAEIVQEVIRTKVEELTGKKVTRVSVTVQDLEEKVVKPEPEEDKGEEEVAEE